MDEQAASPPRRFPWPLAALWAAALASAFGLSLWIQGERAERRQREGTRLASQAAELAGRARTASDSAEGAELLEEARRLLEEAEAAGAARAGVRVDLASLLLRAGAQEHLARAQTLLAEAWDTPDLPSSLRARIARDRGAAELLAGEAEAAQGWYERAAALEPGAPGEALEALRRSARRDDDGAR